MATSLIRTVTEAGAAPSVSPTRVVPHTGRAQGVWRTRLVRGLIIGTTLMIVLLQAYTLAIRPWHLRWGASDAEVTATLPGDDLVRSALQEDQSTRAITINAPAESIWPWLVQWGQDKGGWYSYETLENLLGCNMTNADRIHAEWQNTQVGDYVRMYPEGAGPPPYRVATMAANRAFVIGHPEGDLDAPVTAQTRWHDTWAFVLQPVDAQSTRLLIRARWTAEGDSSAMNAVMKIIEPGAFIMERGSLWGVKERVERAAGLPAEYTATEGWGVAFMLTALVALAGIFFSKKWPLKLGLLIVGGLVWWLVLFFGHPNAYLSGLLAAACIAALVWSFWPERKRNREEVA